MIIDSHTHIGKLPNSLYSESYEKNFDLILKEAKENGVDKLVIIAGMGKKDEFNISTESLINLIDGHENVSAVAGMDVINYQEEDLEELENFLENKKIVAIKLYTGYLPFYPNDERCKPIYNIALKFGVPIIFHSGDTLAGVVPNPKVKYSHPLHIDEVAADFPDMKIIIAHMGNPWLIDCAEVLYKNPNVYADISGIVVGNELNTPYGQLMSKRIKELLDYVGENKLLYGTDWPLCNMKPYIEFMKNLGLNDIETEKLFSGNAIKLFKF